MRSFARTAGATRWKYDTTYTRERTPQTRRRTAENAFMKVDGKTLRPSRRRALLVPIRPRLIGGRDGDERLVREGAARELESRGEAVLSEPVRHGERGLAREVPRRNDRRAAADPGINLVEVRADRIRDGRPRRRDERVEVRVESVEGLLHRRAEAQRLDVVDREDHGRRVASPAVVRNLELLRAAALDEVAERARALGRHDRPDGGPVRELRVRDVGDDVAEGPEDLQRRLEVLPDFGLDLVRRSFDDADPEPAGLSRGRRAWKREGPRERRRVVRIAPRDRGHDEAAVLGRPAHRAELVERPAE